MGTETLADFAECKGVELFKAGYRRDSSGEGKFWSIADLDEMAESYNAVVGKVHDAPVQIGHDTATAYGWLVRAYRDGDRLLGDYADVDEEFAAACDSKKYRKRSISIYPPSHGDNPTPGKWNIRHVAYVGVPAVKGMKDQPKMKYAEAGDRHFAFGEAVGCLQFDEANSMNFSSADVAMLFQNLRDRMIAEKGLEEADAALPPDLINNLQSSDQALYGMIADLSRTCDVLQQQILQMQQEDADEENGGGDAMSTYQESPKMETENKNEQATEQQDRLAKLEADFAASQARIAALESTNQFLVGENTRLQGERERAEVENFVEGLIRDKKTLTPEDRESTIQLAMALPNDKAQNFTEGGQTVERTPREAYLQQLANRKPLYSTAPVTTQATKAAYSFNAAIGCDVEDSGAQLHQQVLDYCATKGWDIKQDPAFYERALVEVIG